MACTVPKCRSRGISLWKHDNISFHRFPVDPETRKMWVKNVRKRDDWSPSQYTRICSLHFEASCFREGYGRRTLHSHAVPTIFPNIPPSCRPKLQRKRIGIAKYGATEDPAQPASASTSTTKPQPTVVLDDEENKISLPLPQIVSVLKVEKNDKTKTDMDMQKELQKTNKLLDHYKKLAAKRRAQLKNTQRKYSRLAKKTADLEVIIESLYQKMEDESDDKTLGNHLVNDTKIISGYVIKTGGDPGSVMLL